MIIFLPGSHQPSLKTRPSADADSPVKLRSSFKPHSQIDFIVRQHGKPSFRAFPAIFIRSTLHTVSPVLIASSFLHLLSPPSILRSFNCLYCRNLLTHLRHENSLLMKSTNRLPQISIHPLQHQLTGFYLFLNPSRWTISSMVFLFVSCRFISTSSAG